MCYLTIFILFVFNIINSFIKCHYTMEKKMGYRDYLINEEVKDLSVSEGKISEIITSERKLNPDEVVLAAGSWSPLLTKKLGIKIPIQAGKGYRINVNTETSTFSAEINNEIQEYQCLLF